MDKKFNITKLHFLIFLIIFVNAFAILSFFKYSLKDEVIYLQETLLITDLLKTGSWIGNYPVGTHGFIFKIPLALIYLVTGPSTFWSTIYSALFSGVSIILLFKIARKHFQLNDKMALLVCLLFMTSMQFFNTTFTYLREPFVTLPLLVFIYFLLEKKNSWILGFTLVFILDAKEHYFYMTYLAYITFLFYYYLPKKRLKTIIYRAVTSLIPSLIFTILMFKTSLIPINIYNAYVLGLVDGGLSGQIKQINTGSSSNINYSQVNLTEINKDPVRSLVYNENVHLAQKRTIVTKLIGYVMKIFNPRIFGYLSVHIFIITVTTIGALYFLVKGNQSLQFISAFYLVNIGIYMLYYSHGRYLFPITPIIFLIFIKFIDLHIQNEKWIVILGVFLSIIAYFFEVTYIFQKLILFIIFLAFIGLFYVLRYIVKLKDFITVFILIIPFCLFGVITGLIYLYTIEQGQIKKAYLFGTDGEMNKIQELVKYNDNVYINENTRLFSFYRNNLFLDNETKYELKSTISKKYLMKHFSEQKTFSLNSSLNNCGVENKNTNTNTNTLILVVKSRVNNFKFPYENCKEILEENKEISPKGTYKFKNKDVYLFEMH